MNGLEGNLGRGGDGNSVASNIRGVLRNMPSNVIKPTIDSLETAANFVLRPWYGSALYGTYESFVKFGDSLAKALKRLSLYGREGAANRVARVERAEEETQPTQTITQPRVWLPPNYQKPDDPKRLHLEVDNILSFAKKVADYDVFRFGNQIIRSIENGLQVVGLLDPNTGIITTTDENLYSAVVRAIESRNSRGLNYRIIGTQFKN